MGRKRIHENNSLRYKAYRLRKEENGRFIRLYVPADIDRQFNLKGNPGRLLEFAVELENLTEEFNDAIKNNLFFLLWSITESLSALKDGKRSNVSSIIKPLLFQYFDKITQQIIYCTKLGLFSHIKGSLKIYAKDFKSLIKNLEKRMTPEQYEDLCNRIMNLESWLEEER